MKKFLALILSLFIVATITLSCKKSSSKPRAENKKDVVPVVPVDAETPIVTPKVVATQLKGLMVFIDFSDAPSTIPINKADSIINGLNYTEAMVSTTVRKYWMTQSRGKIDLQHDVIGYFRAPHTAEWYKSQSWTEFLTLSKLALEWVKASDPNYDWNSLSLSKDAGEEGTLLSVNFFTTVWIAGSGGTHQISDWTAPGGKKVRQITAQSFFNQDPKDLNVNLFWICHEMGHSVWGVPDTYDHDGSSEGGGKYSVMGGNMNNGHIEAFGAPFLMKQGWVDVVDIQLNGSYTLPEDGNTIARYKNPSNPKEYFLIEARKKGTPGNEMIPTKRGLLIWHVDENVTTGNDLEDMTPTAHYAHSIEQADGRFDLEHGVNSYDGGDYYIEGQILSDSSTPNSKWWDGSSSTINIKNIKFLPDNKISFCNGTCP